MRVLLISVDKLKMPNLALEKIKLYHVNMGDEVFTVDYPMLRHTMDRIYVSVIFSKNKQKAAEWLDFGDKVIIGGSGWDIHKNLPSEIDELRPKINFGFTTRGCNRDCPFCIVPYKEGTVSIEADLMDIWDGKAKKVILMDNNILFAKSHFYRICKQAIDNKILLDFNQGLDHRLLTNDICAMLKQVRHKEYRFAFDSPKQFNTVSNAIDRLEKAGIKQSTWYVLCGFDTSFEQDLERLEFLKSRNQIAYAMRYQDIHSVKKYVLLASWTNQHNLFKKWTFDKFCLEKYGKLPE